jgi:hypothetical protein
MANWYFWSIRKRFAIWLLKVLLCIDWTIQLKLLISQQKKKKKTQTVDNRLCTRLHAQNRLVLKVLVKVSGYKPNTFLHGPNRIHYRFFFCLAQLSDWRPCKYLYSLLAQKLPKYTTYLWCWLVLEVWREATPSRLIHWAACIPRVPNWDHTSFAL